MTPLVSVVMPCFNAATCLDEAVDSILGQSYRHLEFIIVDDGSTDGTAGLLAAVTDPRVRVLRNEFNRGVVESLNRGFAEARGELIARMDADDIALPDRLDRQVAQFLHDRDLAVLGTAVSYIDGEGRPLPAPRRPPATDAAIRWRLLFSNCLHHPTVMFRRAMLPVPVYSSLFPDIEDWELWFRLGNSLKLGAIRQRLLKHRRHAASVSGQRQAGQRAAVARLLQQHVAARLGVRLSLEETLALYHPPACLGSDPLVSRYPLGTLLELRRAFLDAHPRLGAEDLRCIDTDIAFFALRSAAMARAAEAAPLRRRWAMGREAVAVLLARPASAVRAIGDWLRSN